MCGIKKQAKTRGGDTMCPSPTLICNSGHPPFPGLHMYWVVTKSRSRYPQRFIISTIVGSLIDLLLVGFLVLMLNILCLNP